jgi:hypothetical protein
MKKDSISTAGEELTVSLHSKIQNMDLKMKGNVSSELT